MDGAQHGGPRRPCPGPCSKCCCLLGAVTPHGKLRNGKDVLNAERGRHGTPHERRCPRIGQRPDAAPRTVGGQGVTRQPPAQFPTAATCRTLARHGKGPGKMPQPQTRGERRARSAELICTSAFFQIDANKTRRIEQIGQILAQSPSFSLSLSMSPYLQKLFENII